MANITAVGIDLGTTYSAVARLDEAGRTAMVRNAEGDVLTPSVVLFEADEVLVGKEAKKVVGVLTDRVAECVKRDMGSPHYSQPILGKFMPPEVIQSYILRKLKDDAVAAIRGEIQVVITVPAYFDEPRRKATADAGELAGLHVLDIVNEPTAAALAFGEQLGYLDPSGASLEEMKVLVYDLGGGTFDVTIINLKPRDIRTLATDGDVQLGGRDWDERLVNHLAEQFLRQHQVDPRQDASALARLNSLAEDAKHTLSARDHARVHFEHAGRAGDYEITRQKFAELTEDLLERTSYTTRQVLAAARLEWRDISHVLLVGGSTRMPMVIEHLQKISGIDPRRNVNPDEAVARGAAIFAGYLLALRDERGPGPKFRVVDVNAHSLGIEGVDRRTGRKENVVLIPRNTPLPFRATEKFVTKHAGQKSIVVQVLEGESKLPSQCSPIARAVMRQLPDDIAQGSRIEVTYEYGANGRLAVRAKLPGAARELAIDLERDRGLSDDRVAKWKRVVEAHQGFGSFESMLEDVLTANGLSTATPVSSVPCAIQQPVAQASMPAFQLGVKPVIKPTARPTTINAPTKSAPGPSAAVAAPAPALPNFQELARMAAADDSPDPGSGMSDMGYGQPTVFGDAPPSGSRKRNSSGWMVNLIGHLLAPIIGLGMGYYILCMIKPEANFLHLDLPGLSAEDPNQKPPVGEAP